VFSLKIKYAAYGAATAVVLALAFLALLAFFSSHGGTVFGQDRVRMFALLGAAAVGGSALLAWSFGRRLTRSLDVVKRSAAQITEGDYTQPLSTERRDELGDLQRTVEHMRQRLRQTTITKNYLHSVLNSMTDAVFVTAPDGTIKIANQAAALLTGVSQEDLIATQIAALIETPKDSDSSAGGGAPLDVLRMARDSGETVLRTNTGQTIPVSFTGSEIATDDPQFEGCIFVARNITDRKRAERRIRYLARYDALTKIPNRMQFQHLLQQAIARSLRARGAIALLYLDMDRFKEVNDTFGHGAGDRVLEVLTERLTRVLPHDTVLGRLAGDEFALFIDGLSSEAEARDTVVQLARSILRTVGAAFHVNEQEVFLTASIGVALCPRDAENVIDLIRNADAAMYHSKQNGGNSCVFYAPEMNAAAVERLMLKSKLKRALERDELVVRYQPKVRCTDGFIVGAEALLRWRLPGHGDIPPSQFIPLAEENNLILGVGEWVLNRVCLDYKAMSVQVQDPGRIALNLSLKQLRQASFILRCRSVFERHGVSPENLELEITETTLMNDPKRTISMLYELHAMGLHLAIDDFGTGYSSLSALQQFPIGTLKIDQSFVRDSAHDANDATLVRTIIDMGRSLSMEVVAEGVETTGQLEFLREAHCHYAQGRLFGEPLTCDELLAMLQSQQNGAPPFQMFFPRGRNAATVTPVTPASSSKLRA
jgi:diguanylate cyclase (GGDEF)-like protein/PAS domain S-box-containing protein